MAFCMNTYIDHSHTQVCKLNCIALHVYTREHMIQGVWHTFQMYVWFRVCGVCFKCVMSHVCIIELVASLYCILSCSYVADLYHTCSGWLQTPIPFCGIIIFLIYVLVLYVLTTETLILYLCRLKFPTLFHGEEMLVGITHGVVLVQLAVYYLVKAV